MRTSFSLGRGSARPAAAHRRTAPARPRVEFLEDRCVPSAGLPDPVFGIGGLTTTAFFGPPGAQAAHAVAVEADGKIVAAGGYHAENSADGAVVARYNANGSPDRTFGDQGKVPVALADATGVAVQADQKIVVAGYVGGHGAVVRLNPDGSPDPSFNGVGGQTVSALSEVRGVAIQPADQKIVVAGVPAFTVARLNPDGSPDLTFNPTGPAPGTNTIAFGFPLTGPTAAAVALDPTNGEIVLAGSVGYRAQPGFPPPPRSSFQIARFTRDGRADASNFL